MLCSARISQHECFLFQLYNRYYNSVGIRQGDIIYVVGQAIEDAAYEGSTIRDLKTIDTSCSRQFRGLVRKASIEAKFSTLEKEWWQMAGHGFLLEGQKQSLRTDILKFRTSFKVKLLAARRLLDYLCLPRMCTLHVMSL